MNFVDRIFVGELTNTIMCEECEHVSFFGLQINDRSHVLAKYIDLIMVFIKEQIE